MDEPPEHQDSKEPEWEDRKYKWNQQKWQIHVPSGNLAWLLKMAHVIVDLPIKDTDFPWLCKCLPDGKSQTLLPAILANLPLKLSFGSLSGKRLFSPITKLSMSK